jgi:hypothetical protein
MALRTRPTSKALHRFALVELFTSECCHSCPTANRRPREEGARSHNDRSVPLALHIGYWNNRG